MNYRSFFIECLGERLDVSLDIKKPILKFVQTQIIELADKLTYY